MGIFHDFDLTTEQGKKEKLAFEIKQDNESMFNYLVSNFKRGFDKLYRLDPKTGLTPTGLTRQQNIDALGEDVAAIFQATEDLRALIMKLKPTTILPTLLDYKIIASVGQDGKITLTNIP